MIPFGPFRPDVGGPGSGMAANALNAAPQRMAGGGVGYGPFPKRVVPSGASALPAAVRGMTAVVESDGTWDVFAATATNLYQMSSSYDWTSIDSSLSVTSGDDVIFEHFGSYLLNTNTTDGLQAYNLETPGTNDAVSGAPKARYIFSASNVLFALDCDGSNQTMQSTAIGDHTNWSDEGALSVTFQDGGALIAGFDLKGGRAVIFQERAIRIITFGEGPTPTTLYRIDKAADGRGSVGYRSIVSFDGAVYYLDTNGFYRFDLANGNVPIGAGKIDEWFLNRLDASAFAGVQGFADPAHKRIIWRYQSKDVASSEVYEDAICYQWDIGEWFPASFKSTYLSRIATPGYTLEDMDDFGTLDGMEQIPLDDRFWQGGQPVPAGLDEDRKFFTFSGTPMAATLETSVSNFPTSVHIGRATPIDDCSTGTLQLGVSDDLSSDLTWKTGASRGRAGRVPLRGRGLNAAFRRNIPEDATWTYANGVDHLETSAEGPA